MKDNLRQIKKINKEISGALKFWQDMLLISDADQWSYLLDYSDEDLLNALYIFNHVAQNIAIKNGQFKNEEDIVKKMTRWRTAIQDVFGFDTVELTHGVLNKPK
jgi:beta-lactamase class D